MQTAHSDSLLAPVVFPDDNSMQTLKLDYAPPGTAAVAAHHVSTKEELQVLYGS